MARKPKTPASTPSETTTPVETGIERWAEVLEGKPASVAVAQADAWVAPPSPVWPLQVEPDPSHKAELPLSAKVCLEVLVGWKGVTSKTPSALEAAEILLGTLSAGSNDYTVIVAFLEKVARHVALETKDRLRAAKMLRGIGL